MLSSSSHLTDVSPTPKAISNFVIIKWNMPIIRVNATLSSVIPVKGGHTQETTLRSQSAACVAASI